MSTKHTRGALTLTVQAAATTGRVAKSAQLLDALVRELGLPEESFTLVVNNFKMSTELRAQDDSGEAVLRDVYAVAVAPDKQLKDTPHARDIARLLAKLADEFREDAPALKLKGAKARVHLSQTKARALRSAAETPEEAGSQDLVLRGNSEIRSPVLRVGRSMDSTTPTARVLLNGKATELPFDRASVDGLLAAVKSGAPQRLKISAAWRERADGSIATETGSVRIIAAEPAKVMSGAELLRSLPKVSQESFDAVMQALDESRGEDEH